MELIIGARNKRDQKVIEKFISLYSIQELSDAIGHNAHQRVKQYAKSHGLLGRCTDRRDSNGERSNPC